MAAKITEKSFDKQVYGAGRPVLVEFYASWCPKCAMMEDVVQEFAEMYSGVEVYQADIETEPGLADRYGIESVPAFVAFEKGKPTGAVVGVVPRQALRELFPSLKMFGDK